MRIGGYGADGSWLVLLGPCGAVEIDGQDSARGA